MPEDTLSRAAQAIGAHQKHCNETLNRGASLLSVAHALREQELKRVGSFLVSAQEILAERRADQERKLVAAERALAAFRAGKYQRFDPFRVAGFSPNENSLSRVLARILDPRGAHGLGLAPLRTLLHIARGISPNAGAGIEETLEDTLSIQVIREWSEPTTRPDIAVFSPRFIIFLEHKVWGGRETGGDQTERQWRALTERAKGLGLGEESVLGVLLSPEGTRPTCSRFVPLRTSDLVTALITLIGQTEDSATRTALLAFLYFYKG